MRNLKKRILQYGITAAVGLAIALLIMNAQGLFVLFGNNADTWSILSDAFFVPGMIMISVGALVWIAGTGLFDSVSYALTVAAHAIIPFLRNKPKSYYDYKSEREGKGGKTPMFILYTGGGFLLLAVVFLIAYGAVA